MAKSKAAKPKVQKPAAQKSAAPVKKSAPVVEKPSRVDRQVIRDLAALLEETGLSEIEWSEGKISVRVGRGGGMVAASHVVAAPAPKAVRAAEPVAAAAPSADEDLSKHPGAVKSPMVGTVYVAAQPGAPAFVKVGDTVKEGDTVLIVEAMKTMNPIAAPRGGRIVRIMVSNQQPVEFGQALMIIE